MSDQQAQRASEAVLVTKVDDLMRRNTLSETLATRAAKMNSIQMKLVTTLKTGHDAQLKADGAARVKLPVVLLTAVTQTDGLYTDSFTIYPKSDTIPKLNRLVRNLHNQQNKLVRHGFIKRIKLIKIGLVN